MRRFGLLLVLIAGCTFPDPELRDVFADAAPDVLDAADTAVVDAPVEAPVADVSGCESGKTCDCDGDGDNKPGPGCEGGDCDDGDPRRNSKVTTYQSYPVTGLSHDGDWNCVNGAEREYKDGFTCGGVGGPCEGAQGYKETAPPCGGKATLLKCKLSAALLCVEDTAATKEVTVLCK